MTKEARVYNGVKTVSSINDFGRTEQVHSSKMKLNHQLTSHTRINSKWIKDLNINCNTIKFLEENIVCKISDISHSNIFTNISAKVREIKEN